MTLRELYNELTRRLADVEPDNNRGEALLLLGQVWGREGRALLLGQGDTVADTTLVERCRALLDRRLAGEPLQYILGRWEFMGLPFLVGEGVLIPRPETELLVELTLAHIASLAQPLVLDLCSGSGCIPVSLVHHCPTALAWGVELSPAAYGYLVRNIHLNNAQGVTPVEGDALALGQSITCRRYHAVTANPPYISFHQLGELQREVQHEPAMALDGGDDGLDFYRRIPDIACELLVEGGLLALEIGNEQGEAVCALVSALGYHSVTLHRDLGGNDRVVTAVWGLHSCC